jgi:hypothetical protein
MSRLLPAFVLCGVTAIALLGLACSNNSSAPRPTPTAARSKTVPVTPSVVASPSAGPSATPSPSMSLDQIAGMQSLIEYYQAINAQDYTTAYDRWANHSQASGQTENEFASGFANTVQTLVQPGTPVIQSSGLDIPVDILSVVNNPAAQPLGQEVDHFTGTYHMTAEGGHEVIVSADMTKQPPATEAAVDVSDSTTTLNSYYKAINAGEYGRAYTYWSNNGESASQSFPDFALGFAGTRSVEAKFGEPSSGAAAGSVYATVAAVVIATQSDGSQQAYCGSYVLRRSNVPPFEILGWRIEQANISSLDSIPGPSQVDNLLAKNCGSS